MVWYCLKWEVLGQNQEDTTYHEAKVCVENNKITKYYLRLSKNEIALNKLKFEKEENVDITYEIKDDKPCFTYSDELQETDIEIVKDCKFKFKF